MCLNDACESVQRRQMETYGWEKRALELYTMPGDRPSMETIARSLNAAGFTDATPERIRRFLVRGPVYDNTAEVFRRVMLGPQPPVETIGYCELCGLHDHHLVKGICRDCGRKCINYVPATQTTVEG